MRRDLQAQTQSTVSDAQTRGGEREGFAQGWTRRWHSTMHGCACASARQICAPLACEARCGAAGEVRACGRVVALWRVSVWGASPSLCSPSLASPARFVRRRCADPLSAVLRRGRDQGNTVELNATTRRRACHPQSNPHLRARNQEARRDTKPTAASIARAQEGGRDARWATREVSTVTRRLIPPLESSSHPLGMLAGSQTPPSSQLLLATRLGKQPAWESVAAHKQHTPIHRLDCSPLTSSHCVICLCAVFPERCVSCVGRVAAG